MSSLIIKSTKHNIEYNNTGKKKHLKVFLDDYRTVMSRAIDYYWEYYNLNTGTQCKEAYKVPKFYPFDEQIKRDDLVISGRAFKCAVTQAHGMIKSVLKKYNKKLYALHVAQGKIIKNNKKACSKANEARINSWFFKNRFVPKPVVNKSVGAEVNTILVSLVVESQNIKEFDLLFMFSSLFNASYKKYHLPSNKLNILSKQHRRYNHWDSIKQERLKSFLLTENYICIRFSILPPELKKTGNVSAIDQGINTLLTMVDTDNNVYKSGMNNHGFDFKDILLALARKKRGSKSFEKAAEHRKNYINWTINQLDLTVIKELRLEEIINIGYKQKRSKFLNGFTNKLISDKIQDATLLAGVQFLGQSSAYRSQRCNACGFVHYLNRSNKDKEIFHCRCCGHTANADVNAAKNHLVDGLPWLKPYIVKGINRTSGFYWNPVDDEVQGVYSPLIQVVVRKNRLPKHKQ